MTLFSFLFVYVFGGLTFIPLVLSALLLHAHLTLPHIDPKRLADESSDGLRDAADTDIYIKSGGAAALDDKFKGKHDSDVAEGYFAVCREYVPGGVNGKPPERTTPAGEVVREESPSVYQSMYRSLFARQQAPTLEPGKAGGRFAKKPRNVFYVVLRHGHLMLYDDEHQVEVRHVISLAHHKVDLYAGGNHIPEGELWIKRNAVRLTRKGAHDDTDPGTKPFFFFSENCSDKEDFYFALLQNQDRDPQDPDAPPMVQAFDNVHMFNLIKTLHSSNEQFETRWFNALLGRLFLGVYKTQFLEDVIRMKITKKISRVKKPAFLTGIILRNINLGKAAPLITNPKLKDLNIDGNCCVEADFEYTGNARIEIAATVRIDLGTRFKAREVHLVLAVTLKRLAGHFMLRLKPPPSNRVWFTFATPPHMEMTIEPIVSTRQITYGVILRTIESRIREVFTETLVHPYWDDISFLDTNDQIYRGGIWADESHQPTKDMVIPDETPEDETETDVASVLDQSGVNSPADDQSANISSFLQSGQGGPFKRKARPQSQDLDHEESRAASSSVEKRPEFPRSLRSTSTLAAPTLSTNSSDSLPVHIEGTAAEKDATSLMREISSRSPPETPQPAPYRDHSRKQSRDADPIADEPIESQAPSADAPRDASPAPSLRSKSSFTGSTRSATSTPESRIPKLVGLAKTLTPSETRQAQLAALAQTVPRSWTWGAAKNKPKHSPNPSGSSTPNNGEPFGRGRPLPPPGQPLPHPERASTFAASAANLLKRRSVPVPVSPVPPSGTPPPLPERVNPAERKDSLSSVGEIKRRPVPPPPLPSRRSSRAHSVPDSEEQQDLVVVKAPVTISMSEDDEAEMEEDLGSIPESGMAGDAAEELAYPQTGRNPAHTTILEPKSTVQGSREQEREDLTASEMAARASFSPADLEAPPG